MAAAGADGGGSSVIIKLIADDNIKEIPKRTITLTPTNNTLSIGRASKVATKGFTAAADNAWFDSPVMSRSHAEIMANFDDKTVSLRDIASLHGTYIDHGKERIRTNNLVKIRDGCQVTFGAPILRNSESFAPPTIRIGITHSAGSSQSRAPSSTFALPEYVDDEMSSSEEESGEIAEELAVSQSKSQNKQDIVDLTQSGRQVDMIDLTDKDMLSDLDRADAGDLIDLTSSTRAASADMQGETESQEDTRIIQATAKILDDIDDNESNREASDMTSPSPEHSVAGPDSDGFSSDLETNSTDSDVDMDDDHSDDDEDIDGDSDDEKENWDAEYSSDDDVLDEEDPDTAVWPRPETQPADNTVFTQHGSNGVEHNPVFGNDETLDFGTPHNAGIAHPAAFAGPYPVPYYPMSNSPSMFQSQPTLPSLCEPPVSHQARPSSPSDAALPKRSVPPTLPNLSYPSAESLGEATGKQEFFAARAENKRRVFAPSLYRRLESPVRFVPCTMPRVDHAKQAEIDNSKNVDMASEEHHVAPAQTPVATPGFVAVAAAEESQQPAEPVLASVPQSSAANPTVVITPLLQKGDDFLNDARSAFNIRLPAFSGDDLGEPISAFDLQQRKVAAKKKADLHLKKLDQDQHELWLAETRRDEGRNPTTECGHSSRRTHVGISDLVEAQKPEEPAQAPVAGKGKRKAAEMAELTETEIQWEAAETNLMGHLRAAHESLVQAPLEQNHFRLANVQEGRVLTMSSHVESSTDRRTPKRLRLRKIAERLGYAALGGATVGAALVSTLIYTAPTFT